jgi:hypothetical protein
MTILEVQDLARAKLDALAATVQRRLTEGSSGNYAAAALIGFAAFGLAIIGQEGAGPAIASPAQPATEIAPSSPLLATRAEAVRTPDSDERPRLVLAERESAAGAEDLLLTYDVEYFWPDQPQTVAVSTRVRSRPENGAKILTLATPGQRLRINGRIRVGATDWYRVRLPDARDGYFAGEEHVMALADYRRRATARREMVAAQPQSVDAVAGETGAIGAPLGVSVSVPQSDEILPLF